jgi:hypothetical protein
MIEINDVHSLILSLHIAEVCEALDGVWARG